jgi:hypothetical protein
MPPNAAGEAHRYSPTLARLLKSRLAPVREAALLNAAMGDDKPLKPAVGDCCGSSCNPCIMDLYREELKVWKECAEYRRSVRLAKNASSGPEPLDSRPEDKAMAQPKMPGSFDW